MMSEPVALFLNRWMPRLIQALFLIALLVAWFVATGVGGVSPFLLPAPGDVTGALWALLRSGSYLPNLGVTLSEVGIAFCTSTVAGLVIGYGISRSRALVRVFEPLLSSLYAVPVVLFLPLFILMFGLGIASKIAMGITTSFFPVVMSAIAGFSSVERIFVTAARSMGASNFQLFRRVLLPAALPVIVSGLRMAFIVAFLSILGAETIASYAGLGHGIVQHAELLETKEMFANIALVIAIATILNLVLSAVERNYGRRS
jgi:ABC-type nitrate/sulfonate/bicarbonate transport system permease component